MYSMYIASPKTALGNVGLGNVLRNLYDGWNEIATTLFPTIISLPSTAYCTNYSLFPRQI